MRIAQRPFSRRTFLSVLGWQFAAVLLPYASPTASAAATAAEKFVTSLAGKVLAAARTGSGNRFRRLLRHNAAIPTIAMFSLGRYRSTFPANRRQEYFSLFEGYVANVFASNANRLRGSRIRVTGSRQRADSVIVNSEIEFADAQRPVPVSWRLVHTRNGYKIFDVKVLGIWLPCGNGPILSRS